MKKVKWGEQVEYSGDLSKGKGLKSLGRLEQIESIYVSEVGRVPCMRETTEERLGNNHWVIWVEMVVGEVGEETKE